MVIRAIAVVVGVGEGCLKLRAEVDMVNASPWETMNTHQDFLSTGKTTTSDARTSVLIGRM